MKRILSVTTLAFAISSVFAEPPTPEPTKPPAPPHVNVFLSSPEYTFEIEGAALFLQPTSSNMHYLARANPLPVPTPNWIIDDIDTKYRPAF